MANFRTLRKNVFLIVILLLILIVPISMSLNDGKVVNKVQGNAVVGNPVNWTVQVGTYKINYETPAPEKIEEDLGNKKRVTVSSNSSEHYNNIKSFSSLPEISYQPKIYHIIDGERVAINDLPEYNVTFLDTNGNGKYDRVEWVIPQLSEQVFEIDLLILNVQSYPIVGGSWTVSFNTSGTANLTIQATDGTNWSNSNETEDLKFLNLKCSNQEVDYQWINNSVFVENYSCDDETSYEFSKVLTAGSHHVKFQFGDLIEYAHNFANGDACGVTFGTAVHDFKDSNGNDIMTIDSKGNLYLAGLSVTNGSSPGSELTNGLNLYGNGLKWAFNKDYVKVYGNFTKNYSGSFSSDSNDILFKNNSEGSDLVLFDGDTGNIYALGWIIYNGTQAGCSEDKYTCNPTSQNIEWGNYWCSIDNNSCSVTYDGVTHEDCTSCVDSDGGINYSVQGTTTDKDPCSLLDTLCPQSGHTDSCSGTELTEWYCTGDDDVSIVAEATDYCFNTCRSYESCDSGALTGFSNCNAGEVCVDGQGCTAGLTCDGPCTSCSNGLCKNSPNTEWGEDLYDCISEEDNITRCYEGSCVSCGGTLSDLGTTDGAEQGTTGCWYSSDSDDSCDTICSSYGGCVNTNWNSDSSCNLISAVLNDQEGETCEDCGWHTGQSVPHEYWDPQAGKHQKCFYRQGEEDQNCSATGGGLHGYDRICLCKY